MEAAKARLSQQLSKCHIVGNHVSRLNFVIVSGDAIAIRKMKFTNLDYASAVSVGILCFLGLINVCICAPLDQYFQTDETEINNPQVRKPN